MHVYGVSTPNHWAIDIIIDSNDNIFDANNIYIDTMYVYIYI